MRVPSDFKGPWRITFDTNPDDCNLNCIMCEENSEFSRKRMARAETPGRKRRMDKRVIRKVVEECQGNGLREIIPSTMGEPLLYQHFDELLSLCNEYYLLLNVTTNGTFPRRSATEWAERICPVGADVKISWNGATPQTQERIMVGSVYERNLSNVQDFVSVRNDVSERGHYCTVTLQMTFMENNLKEIPEIVEMAASLGADRVKGHHLWVNFPEMLGESLRRSSGSIQRWNSMLPRVAEAAEQHRLPSGKRISLDNFFPLAPGVEEMISGSVCPFLGKEAWINHEGRFDPCCAPDNLRRTLGHFGSVVESPFRSLWTNAEYIELCRSYHGKEVCRNCNMRRPKEGG